MMKIYWQIENINKYKEVMYEKENHVEILEWINTMTEMKLQKWNVLLYRKDPRVYLNGENKHQFDDRLLEILQYVEWKKNEERWTASQRNVGHHQAHKYT